MTTEEIIIQLQTEGFQNVATRSFEPNAILPEHTHEKSAVSIMTAGQMTVLDENGSTITKAGERTDYPAGTKHSGVAGPEGCSFILGEK